MIKRSSELAPRQVVEVLKEEVERHRDGAEPNDDFTLLCLRVK
jgi:serine phosphatase RsbU (regulator of sigma subunit)